MLSFDHITTPSDFASLRDEWDDLLHASGSDSLHGTHSWLSAWAATFGSGSGLCVLRIRDGNQTIGFAPLMSNSVRVKRFLPYRQLLWMGDPWIDFGDFIIAGDRRQVIDATLRQLSQNEEWGELLLHGLPETSPNIAVLRDAVGTSAEWKIDSPCYYIPMKDRRWDDFWPTTNKNFVRKDIVRLGNHYQSHDWSVSCFGSESVMEHLPTLAAMHASSQERKGRDSFYNDPMFKRFIEALRNDPLASKWIRGYVLSIDGDAAAFVLGFERRRIFHYWTIGFNDGFAKLSPSKFLLYHILREGFETERWDEFNFMRGATDYKRRWASHSYDLYQVRVLNTRGVYGAMNRLRRGAVTGGVEG